MVNGHTACGRKAHCSGIGGKPLSKREWFYDESVGSELLFKTRTKSLEMNIEYRDGGMKGSVPVECVIEEWRQ